jgi:hypothetical protein
MTSDRDPRRLPSRIAVGVLRYQRTEAGPFICAPRHGAYFFVSLISTTRCGLWLIYSAASSAGSRAG